MRSAQAIVPEHTIYSVVVEAPVIVSGVQWIPLGIAPEQLLKAKAGRLGLVHQVDEQAKDTCKFREGSRERRKRRGFGSADYADSADELKSLVRVAVDDSGRRIEVSQPPTSAIIDR